MNHSDLIPIADILSDVVQLVGDPEYKKGLSKGWYTRQVKKAMEELAIDTFAFQTSKDLPFPKDNLILTLPNDFFNIRSIFLFRGECDNPIDIRRVLYKYGANNSQGGEQYTRNRMEGGNDDPQYPRDSNYNLYTATPQNGNTIGFSSVCKDYDWVRLEYNSFGGDVDEMPVIPRIFRMAVIDFVRVEVLKVFLNFDKGVATSLQVAMQDKAVSQREASYRSKKMDKWIRENYKEYFAKGNW